MSEAETSLRQRLPVIPAAVGLLLSAALEVVHFRAYTEPSASSFCSVGEKLDCSVVALSRWSVVLGVPVPLWGVAGFLALTLLAWFRSRLVLPLAAAASLASVGLLAVEVLSIHSVCLLCEGVHLASFVLLALAWSDRASLVDVDSMTLVHVFTVPVGVLVFSHTLLTPYWAQFSWEHGVTLPHGVDADGNHWIGAERPKVTVHEYVDYACPHCAVATSKLRRLLAAHAGSLRVVHHNYPRMRCPANIPTACTYARAADCAGDQGKFWEMDSWLFAHAPGRSKVDLEQAPTELHFDGAAFSSCLERQETYARADAEALAASKAHVLDAPSYVIDGKKYVGGEVFQALARLR